MENIKAKDNNQIDWEDVLEFLNNKKKLVTKFEASFNKRKQELDVS